MATYRSRTVDVLGTSLHYLETGTGRPVLLLHGNPTCSFLWRHVLRRAAVADHRHRWIAPDLIGMGASGKPALEYRLADHIAHIDAFIAALDLRDVVLVGHDWGVAIALDRLRRYPGQVRAVAVMEGHLRPLPGWQSFDEGGRTLFQNLRTPGLGEQMVLDDNFFIDTLLPAGLSVTLPLADLAVYRSPYRHRASRRPLLQWAREIPVGGEPADVADLLGRAAGRLSAANLPKLLLHSQPGILVTEDTVGWCRSTLSQLTVVDVGGPAGHFLPEDRPEEVADALTAWVGHLPDTA